jgi:hypothetical protein
VRSEDRVKRGGALGLRSKVYGVCNSLENLGRILVGHDDGMERKTGWARQAASRRAGEG